MFYVLNTGEKTHLIKVGRFQGSQLSQYPWQYLYQRYRPLTNATARILLMRHIVNSNGRTSSYAAVRRYEADVKKFLQQKPGFLRPKYGDEWFEHFPKTLDKIKAALNKTDMQDEFKASPKPNSWMAQHFAGSPKYEGSPRVYVPVMKTAAQGKPRGKNHVARSYKVLKKTMKLAELREAVRNKTLVEGKKGKFLNRNGGFYYKVNPKLDLYVYADPKYPHRKGG
jgi:hypothetical protein